MQNYSSLQENHDQEEQGVLLHIAEPTRSKWNHLEDLDSFFSRVYMYHQKHGFACIVLQEVLNLVQFIFIVFLTLYLMHGIDYYLLFGYTPGPGRKLTLDDVIYPVDILMNNFNGFSWLVICIAAASFIGKFFSSCYHINFFWDIKQFYNTALSISDSDLDNCTWHEVQTRLKSVQRELQMCIHKRDLTELDIYHRILRQENYIVAMTNKQLLPPRMRIPILGEYVYWTKLLHYNIQFILFWSPWAPFENSWHLNEEYKKHNMRNKLAQQLGRQILFLALINLILAPIIFIWQILFTLFSYGEIIKREPGQMGTRGWSLYAKLYIRHFQELDHELHARLTRAYRPALKYLSAFNSPIAAVIAQYVGFLCGALFTVMVALTIYDEDVLAVDHVITIITALGGVTAVCRNFIPDETVVWCPEQLLEHVVMNTHYLPPGWREYAHTSKIREGFQQLFQMHVVAVLEDLLSPILTPFLLWWYVYPRSLDLVDFLRNFTVSVVGVGDVCSFAQMDIKKNGNPEWQTDLSLAQSQYLPDQYTQAEDGKLELSLVHFTTTNPSWVPPPDAVKFVESLQDELGSVYDNSDEKIVFPSFENLRSGSLPGNEARRSMQAKSVYMDDLPSMTLGASAFRKSVRMLEGPDLKGALNMRTSAIALHNRHHRKMEGHTRSLEEITPLLTTTKIISSFPPKT